MFGRLRGERAAITVIVSAACAAMLTITGTSGANANANTDPEKVVTTIQEGTHDGCYYWFWQDQGDASMTLRRGGYSARWSEINNWIGGKGWETGGPRRFSYSGTFEPGRNSYLALYGWMKDPLLEYYIVENWGTYRPSGVFLGTVTSEGGTYDLYRELIVQMALEQPTWYRYWSIRQEKRTGGTINTADHFDAWTRAGMKMGTPDLMIMATEGYHSIGSSDITVDCRTAEPSSSSAGPVVANPVGRRPS
jgi:endo-1,4-beta-xylanase